MAECWFDEVVLVRPVGGLVRRGVDRLFFRKLSPKTVLSQLVPSLVLDEQGYELLHRRVEQGFSLRGHDAVDLIRLGWLTLVVDQLVAQAPLQAFDASVVERVERHAHW
jgi:hypothetical protein